MSRWDCEGAFYRVFCISLLIIAFTFTVILTNVFVDIDNLLSKREEERTENALATEPTTEAYETTAEIQDYYIGLDTNEKANYRSKRSFDSQNIFRRRYSPNTKNYLTSKLASLLEVLDYEDNTTQNPETGNIYIKTVKQKNNIAINEMLPGLPLPEPKPEMQAVENIIYLALHNMLQGVEHVDINLLLKKLQELVRNFKQIDNQRSEQTTVRGPRFLVKTLIDIEKLGDTNSTEDYQGIVKLMYNGKPFNINGEDLETVPPKTNGHKNITADVEDFDGVLQDIFIKRHKPETYLKNIAHEYIKKFEKQNDSLIRGENIRIKRNLESDEKSIDPISKDDEELFVEIETHFDKSGIKGEKKRKLVGSLIEKIRNALRSSREGMPFHDNNQRKSLIKRIQSPLDRKTVIEHPKIPASSIYRTLEPIGSKIKIVDNLPRIDNVNEEKAKKLKYQPKFLSLSKSINSAELSQVTVDYQPDSKYDGILIRMQHPLSTDTSREIINSDDIGKLQLLNKDIEGTGFSIGYNQYLDQAPDPESINLFHGIENLIKQYHQKNDDPNLLKDYGGDYEIYGQALKKRELRSVEAPIRTKRFVLNRKNIRQSVKKVKDLKNEHIFMNDYDSYNSYNEFHDTRKTSTELLRRRHGQSSIINAHRKKRSLTLKTIINSNKKITRLNKYLNTNSFILLKRIFNLNKRSKRHVGNVIAIDKAQESQNKDMFTVSDEDSYNDKNPYRKNRPLFQPSNYPLGSQTHGIQNRKMFNINSMFVKSNLNDYRTIRENKERIKRQLHTLRIIENSDNDTNEAYEKSISEPQTMPHDHEDEKREYIGEYNNSGMEKTPVNPLVGSNEEGLSHHKPTIFTNTYKNLRHEFSMSPSWKQVLEEHPLMAKYPHIFGEVGMKDELSSRKHLQAAPISKEQIHSEESKYSFEKMRKLSKVQDLVNGLLPHKKRYKVSIRLIPHENEAGQEGKPEFKEIHTSLNKSFNQNGMEYFTLLNISQISHVKVPDTNKTPAHHLETIPNITEVTKPHHTNEQSKIDDIDKIRIGRTKPIETNTKAENDMKLMDVIVPSNPHKIVYLNVADLGKIIYDAIKSRNLETSSALQDKGAPLKTTTLSTTMITKKLPDIDSTYIPLPTEDPLKIKLLESISQNGQITSQILSRIDKNTEILQTFLSKITEEIAKIPEKNSLNSFRTTTTSIPVPQFIPQISYQNQAPMRIKAPTNVIKVETRAAKIKGNNDENAKYFLDKAPEEKLQQQIILDNNSISTDSNKRNRKKRSSGSRVSLIFPGEITSTTKKPDSKTQSDFYDRLMSSSYAFSKFVKHWKYTFKIYKSAILREIRNFKYLTRFIPPGQFLMDYFYNNFTFQGKPEAERAINSGVKLTIRNVFGIQHFEIPKSYIGSMPKKVKDWSPWT